MRYVYGYWIALALVIMSMTIGCAKEDEPYVPEPVTNVKCYSKGQLVFDGQAKGDVWVSYDSPRVEFRSADNGNTVTISGAECIVGDSGVQQ